MTWDQAVAAIEAEGLTATSAYVYDDAAADGTILGHVACGRREGCVGFERYRQHRAFARGRADGGGAGVSGRQVRAR